MNWDENPSPPFTLLHHKRLKRPRGVAYDDWRMYLPTPLAATAPATPQSQRILPTVAIKAR